MTGWRVELEEEDGVGGVAACIVTVDSEQHYSRGHSPGERSRDGPTAMLTATSTARTVR